MINDLFLLMDVILDHIDSVDHELLHQPIYHHRLTLPSLLPDSQLLT